MHRLTEEFWQAHGSIDYPESRQIKNKKLNENLNGRLSSLDIDKLQEALAELDNKDIIQVVPHPTIDNVIVAQVSESYMLYINDRDEVEVAQISDTGELLDRPRVIASMSQLS